MVHAFSLTLMNSLASIYRRCYIKCNAI